MKSFKTTVILFVCFFCSAQTVRPLFQRGYNIEGSYYKDLDHDFDKFLGTWQYTSGTTSLTIVLVKKEDIYLQQSNSYCDFIVGEYKYV